MDRNISGESRIEAVARRQFGVFSRQQAFDAGFSRHQIEHRLATGRWETVLPGVYRIAGAPSSVRQRFMAATLWGGTEAVISHRAAGLLWHMDGIRTRRAELIVPGKKLRHDVVLAHYAADLTAPDRSECYGIPVTAPARTLVDLSAVIDGETLETALEDALHRRLTSQARLEWRLEELGRRSGIAELKRILARRDDTPLESRLEVRLERLLRKHGLPLPERQRTIEDPGRRMRVDFCYPDHALVVECVSWRFHSGQKPWRDDIRRRRRLAAQGQRVIEFTWAEVSWEPAVVVTDLTDALGYSPPASSSYSA